MCYVNWTNSHQKANNCQWLPIMWRIWWWIHGVNRIIGSSAIRSCHYRNFGLLDEIFVEKILYSCIVLQDKLFQHTAWNRTSSYYKTTFILNKEDQRPLFSPKDYRYTSTYTWVTDIMFVTALPELLLEKVGPIVWYTAAIYMRPFFRYLTFQTAANDDKKIEPN